MPRRNSAGSRLQVFGDLVELHFLAEPRLRRAVATFGPARRLVGEDAAASETIAGNVVGDRLQRTRVERARHAVRAVGAAVEQRLQIQAGDPAVVGHTGTEAHQHRMATAMAIEHLFAVEADLHRPIEQQGRFGDDDLVVERIALAAEAAAVGRGDDADVRRRHRQRLGEGAVQVVRRLRARVDHELAVRVLQRHGRVLFDRQMGIALEEKHIVEDVIGAVDRLIDIAELERHGFVHVAVVAVVVNPRLGMGQAVGGRSEGAERFVLDVDQVDGKIRRGFVLRNDGRHGIADETDLVAAQGVLVVADRKNAVRNRKRLTGQDQVNTVDLFGLCGVDTHDPRMRLRRTQQPAMQHPRENDVVGEAGLPCDLGPAVHSSSRVPDHSCGARHRRLS